MNTSSFTRLRNLCAAFLLTGTVMVPAVAHAGFQWSPTVPADVPAPAPADADGPAMPAIPQGKVDAASVPTPAAQTPESSAAPATTATASPPQAEPARTAGQAAAEPPVAAETGMPDAVGFGSEIPLVLALQQIVPPQYGYVIDADVNQAAKIDWNGGKPWDQVLNEALKPAGYAASVKDGTIHVMTLASVPVPAAAPAQTKTPEEKPAIPAVPKAEESTISLKDEKPVREVYIRRGEDQPQVEERSPGKPEELAPDLDKPATRTSDSKADSHKEGEQGFWSKANPINWVKSDTHPAPGTAVPPPPEAESAITTEKTTPLAAQASGAPVMMTRMAEIEPATTEQKPVSAEKAAAAASPQKWEALSGQSLHTTLQNWADAAKVKLFWVPSQDYKVPQDIHLQGSFTDAVANILGAYGDKGSRPLGRLHPNLPDGPAVLVIEPSAS